MQSLLTTPEKWFLRAMLTMYRAHRSPLDANPFREYVHSAKYSSRTVTLNFPGRPRLSSEPDLSNSTTCNPYCILRGQTDH